MPVTRTVDTVRQSDSLALIAAEFDKHYQRRCGTRSHLYPQVREVLQALRAQGVKLAVVTNKEVALHHHGAGCAPVDAAVRPRGQRRYLAAKKPDPAGIHSCLAQFRWTADRTLFVGDSSIDVATARNAGVPVWVLPYGYNMGEPIEACAPDRVIADFTALLATLTSLSPA